MDQLDRSQKAFAKAHRCLRQAHALYAINEFDGAVTRAYYALFHATEGLLLTQHGLSFSSHGQVIGAFGRLYVKPGVVPRTMHQLLITAFQTRQAADYDLDVEVSQDDAAECCKAAEEFVHFIQSIT